MLSYPPFSASVRSHLGQAHGRDARATHLGGQAWHGKQLSPKLEAGSPVAAVYLSRQSLATADDRRNDAVARRSAGFQPASAKEAGRDAWATKIRILRIPSMSRVGDRTRTGGHPPSPSFGGTSRPPLQNSIRAQRDSTGPGWLSFHAVSTRSRPRARRGADDSKLWTGRSLKHRLYLGGLDVLSLPNGRADETNKSVPPRPQRPPVKPIPVWLRPRRAKCFVNKSDWIFPAN